MRCFITGVAGFVGSSIADRLLQEGHEVVGVDCFVDYYPRIYKERNLEQAKSHASFEFIESNLLDLNLPEKLDGVDYVFHQAAQAGVRASWGESFSIYTDNNILATQKLLEACMTAQATLKKVVFASSSSVYGDAETLPTDELTRPQPVSPYGVSKLASEHLMVLYAKEFGVPTVSLRYFTVYGPRQRPDMAFHRFIKSALRGEPITLYDDGEQSRDFSFIEDVIDANLNAATKDTAELVYNIGGGSRVTVNHCIETLGNILGQTVAVDRQPRQKGDVKHTAAQTERARRDLDYYPQVALQEGLSAEVTWLEKLLAAGLG